MIGPVVTLLYRGVESLHSIISGVQDTDQRRYPDHFVLAAQTPRPWAGFGVRKG